MSRFSCSVFDICLYTCLSFNLCECHCDQYFSCLCSGEISVCSELNAAAERMRSLCLCSGLENYILVYVFFWGGQSVFCTSQPC